MIQNTNTLGDVEVGNDEFVIYDRTNYQAWIQSDYTVEVQ
jgi:hypothetical protein